MKGLLWAGILLATTSFAFEAPLGLRSPKGLLMGDAWTAVNTDEYTLFYNPASLGRHSRDFTFYPFNPQVTGTNLISDLDRFKNFPTTPNGATDVLMNYPVHVGTNIVPGFKLFNFGFSFIASEQADLLLRNKIHPTLDIDYRSDRGFVAGFAIPLGPGRLKSKSVSGQQTTFGISGKYIKRRGIYDAYALTGTDLLDIINDTGDAKDIVERLGGVQGDGWGFDAGLEHVVRRGANQWVVGVSALDIADTDFDVPTNVNNRVVAPNRSQVNVGASWMFRSNLLKGTLSADVRDLTEERELMERFRFGAELGFSALSVLGGINSGYFSYGLAFDMGLMKLIGGFYGVEVGGAYRRTQSKRFILYLSLFDFSFDA